MPREETNKSQVISKEQQGRLSGESIYICKMPNLGVEWGTS